jgi:Tol biopolymer transport system component/DNA-binding winged helix-turn-helix (wHTH) protein
MSQSPNTLYGFGAFRLDAAERVLWRGEQLIVLPPKVFDTLWVLVKKEGGVVSKAELMEAVWADAFVEESNLSQNIYTLRRTLGVDDQGRQFIETVPRRGYRFAVPVRLLGENDRAQDPVEDVIEDVAILSNAESVGGRLDSQPIDTSSDGSRSRAAAPAPTVAPSAPQTRSISTFRYALAAGLGVMTLSALGLAFYQFVIRRGEPGERTIAPIERVRFQRLTDSGDVVFSTVSPNGELLAYVRHEEEGESVWVKTIATGSAIQTLPPSPKGYRSLAFSPDGHYLFFREERDPGAIYQTSPFGGAPRTIAVNVWSDFTISPDGKQLAFVRRDTVLNTYLLILSSVDGSNERLLSSAQSPHSYRSALAWSPDGSSLTVSATLPESGFPRLLSVDTATGTETELRTPRWRGISRALWMPNGRYLVVSARAIDEPSSQLWMLAYPDGEVRRLTNDLESYFWISLSADGRRLVTRQQRIVTRLSLLLDGNSEKGAQLTDGERGLHGYVGLAWTPDRRIVFSAFAGNSTDLFLMKVDGSDRVQLTANAGPDNTWPTVSQDGRYIVFISNRTGTRQIWRMNIDGRYQKQLTFGEVQRDTAQYPALSPDGSEVYYIRRRAGPASIWKVSIEGGGPVPVSRLTNATTEGFLSISPDGKWLAYRHVSAESEAASEDPTLRIGVLPADGNAEPRLFELEMRRPLVQWSADSASLYYAAGTFDSSSLWRQPLNGDKPQKVLDFSDRVFNFARSRDGSFVVSHGRQQGDAILITNLP